MPKVCTITIATAAINATMVEYAIMVALIAAVAIAIIAALGVTVTQVFTGINAQLGGIG